MSTTAELIAEARRALDESRISPMRSFDDDKDFALAEWSRNNLARLVDALAESERRREAAEKAGEWLATITGAAFFGPTAPDTASMQFTITINAAEWREIVSLAAALRVAER